MNGLWTATGVAQQAAIVAGSAWNAWYFACRAAEAGTARRIAAGVLALLFAGIAVEALAGLPVAATAAEVARRTPLLLATLAVAAIVSYGPPSGGSTAGGAR